MSSRALRNAIHDSAARAVPGVVDVRQVPAGIAVYASNTWSAKRGREALVADWDEGPNKTFSTASQRREYQRLINTPGAVAGQRGDVRRASKDLSAAAVQDPENEQIQNNLQSLDAQARKRV